MFFSRTTQPITTKLGTKHSWMIGFQIYSKEGPLPFQGEIIMKKAKIQNLKIVFSRTTCPISIKLYTKQPWMKGIQVCSNEGPRAFTMGDNSEIAKLH